MDQDEQAGSLRRQRRPRAAQCDTASRRSVRRGRQYRGQRVLMPVAPVADETRPDRPSTAGTRGRDKAWCPKNTSSKASIVSRSNSRRRGLRAQLAQVLPIGLALPELNRVMLVKFHQLIRVRVDDRHAVIARPRSRPGRRPADPGRSAVSTSGDPPSAPARPRRDRSPFLP